MKNNIMKKCNKCGIEKELSGFRAKIKKNKTYYMNTCKVCIVDGDREYKRLHHLKNKEKDNERSRKNYQDNKEERRAYNKKYYENNKKEILIAQKIYQKTNPEAHRKANKKYHQTHKEQEKIYREVNKEKRNAKMATRIRNRRKTDISFKLRTSVSRNINMGLKENSSSKNGLSCLHFLGYSIPKLKQHLESLFESWMNWGNWGKYNSKTWAENDKSTWTWHLDHIIPQSDLLYISMKDVNFKKCWELSNLRPYSAKQNILDGTTRIRHKKW
jgi:hypothetical protein